METKVSTHKIALLIDGDNANSKLIQQVINEAAKFGRVTIKRIYGDWTDDKLRGWKEKLNEFAIRPIQKFAYTTGKNSTDTALIIDAMDMMHAKLVEGFCIVSSDSDYTGLAHRIREEGFYIMGIGKSQTPRAFIKSCENFIYEEILDNTEKVHDEIRKEKKFQPETPILPTPKVIGKINLERFTNKVTKKPFDISVVDDAYNMAVDELSNLALASKLSDAIRKIDSSFDIRNYGFNSFKKFLEELKPRYEIVMGRDNNTTMYIQRKEK